MNPIGFIDYAGLVQVLKAVKSKIDGIIVKLNGSETNVNSTDVDIYVPTESGTSGQYLKSNGEGKAPTWSTISPSSSSGGGSYSAGTGISISDENVISLSPVKKADVSKSPVDTNTYSCQASVELFAAKSSVTDLTDSVDNAVVNLKMENYTNSSETAAKGAKSGYSITGTKKNGTDTDPVILTSATIDELYNKAYGEPLVVSSTGKIASTYMPSYVDDAIEGYLSDDSLNFYSDKGKTTVVTDEGGNNANQQRGKIYLDLSTNTSYRWTGSIYTKIVSGEGYTLPVAGTDTLGGILASKVSSSAVETNTVGGMSDYQGVQVDNEGHAYVQVNGNLGYGAAVTGTAATEIPLGGVYNNYGVDLSQQTGTTFTFSGTLNNGLRYDVNIVNIAPSTKTITIPAAYTGAAYCVFNGSLENIQSSGLSFDITGYTGISLSMTYYPLESGNVLFVTTSNGLSTSAISSATATLD